MPRRRPADRAVRARHDSPAWARRADRRRCRSSAGRTGGAGESALRGAGRRDRHVAQGRQPAGHPAADPVADEEGPRRPRVRARAELRLRRALVRSHILGRSGLEDADRGLRLHCSRDREDREGGGAHRAGRHPPRSRRRDGRARRSRRRDRLGRGAALAEADHPACARARKAGDHRDADARVDDPFAGADAR